MRKRGARIRYQAKAPPGLIAQNINGRYETRLRIAVEAVRGGWATGEHFDDLADTLDLLRLALLIYPGQRHDEGAHAVAELALVAMQNMVERHNDKGRIGATGDELQALELLAETSMDYWNRRSGALFAEAYRQLVGMRRANAYKSETGDHA